MRAADGTPSFIVQPADIVEVLRFLRDQNGFSLLADLTATDWPGSEPRFQVVYNLLALRSNATIRLKVGADTNNPQVPSATGIFPNANWYEREVFDLFGITFSDHPDLRRIEMPEDWDGHPLRKDYPITGPRRPNLPSNQFRPIGRSDVSE
jgi:NADH-quinone oxidoreductase subunit C